MTNRMDSGIINALTALVSTTKSAAEAPTTHPVGKAEDGDQPATTGEFAATNAANAKDTAGTQGVDAAGGTVNPAKKQDDLPSQKELAPGTTDSPPPAEIKPTQVIEGGDGDVNAGAQGGEETGGGGEGRVSGVGGPKFAAASQSILNEADAFLKAASALVPDVQAPAAAPAKAAATAAPAAGTQLVTREEAAALIEAEKTASAQISALLAAAGVAADAPIQVKRAAIVRGIMDSAVKAANGYLVSLDNNTLTAVLSGNTEKLAADDESATLPPTTGTSDAGAGAAVDPMAAAGGAPPADAGAGAPPAGGEGQSQEQLLQEILAAAESGQISPEELQQLLTQMGLPPEAIQQVMAELAQSGAGAAGGAPMGGAAPAGADAGGQVNPVETSDVPAGTEEQAGA